MIYKISFHKKSKLKKDGINYHLNDDGSVYEYTPSPIYVMEKEIEYIEKNAEWGSYTIQLKNQKCYEIDEDPVDELDGVESIESI